MKSKPVIIGAVITAVVCAAAAYYYFCIATLTIADLLPKSNNPLLTIGVRMFDFDTGLTRYDIYRLKSKAPYWTRRISELSSIADPDRKSDEEAKLLTEMLDDPVVKKLAERFGGAGIQQIQKVFGCLQ
jgi:hypothetical protein